MPPVHKPWFMNNHRYLTSIKSIKTLPKLLFCVTKQGIKIRKLNEGVSGELKYSRTHMSLDKKLSRRSFLEATGKALSAVGIGSALSATPFSGAFASDDAQEIASSEHAELQGYRDSRSYARTYEGIGVTIFWGTSPETEEKYGVSKEALGSEIQRLIASAGENSKVNFEAMDGYKHGTIRFHTGKNVSEPISVGQFLTEYYDKNPESQLISMKRAVSDYRFARDNERELDISLNKS